MSKDKQYGKQLPETGGQREVLIQERTTLVEENDFISSEPAPAGAASAMVTRDNYDPTGYGVAAGKPRPQVTHHRPQGDLSDAQFRLLQNLERLTHSLKGPEDSLDRHSYNRPFPPAINHAPPVSNRAQK
jgi:hypothetical protein